MYKQNNISFLVLILLALLCYPGFVKSVHVHEHQHFRSGHTDLASFGQQNEPCPVCDFEFVSFISIRTEQLAVSLQELITANIADSEIPQLPHPVYYSLRAPPPAA
jgi:hypothetical protein